MKESNATGWELFDLLPEPIVVLDGAGAMKQLAIEEFPAERFGQASSHLAAPRSVLTRNRNDPHGHAPGARLLAIVNVESNLSIDQGASLRNAWIEELWPAFFLRASNKMTYQPEA